MLPNSMSSPSANRPWQALVCALAPCEREYFREHLLRLDSLARIDRFGRGVSDYWLTRYAAETDWLRGIVLGCWIDGTLRGVVELRRVGSNQSTTADVGLSVEPPFQNHGLGFQLARRIVVMARTQGVAKLTLLFAAGNWRMPRIAQKLGVPCVSRVAKSRVSW